MKVGMALQQLRDAETELAGGYRKIGERHAADHDVYHLCLTLAHQCEQHIEKLMPFAAKYRSEMQPPDEPSEAWEGLVATMRRGMSTLVGRQPATGFLLLRDLRQLYHLAQDVSLHWIEIGQAAKALRDAAMLEAVTEMHEQTLTQIKWIKTRLKETAPQVLVGG
jgi:predicted  nucleic acid-binding Zn ribbon protein